MCLALALAVHENTRRQLSNCGERPIWPECVPEEVIRWCSARPIVSIAQCIVSIPSAVAAKGTEIFMDCMFFFTSNWCVHLEVMH